MAQGRHRHRQGRRGSHGDGDGAATVVLDEGDIELPDLLTDLQDRTQLTRRTIHRILTDSGRLDDFKRNPQQFIELAAEAINRCKRLAVVDGIKYQRLGDEHYYAQELFETGGADRLPQEHARRQEVGLRAGGLRLRHRARPLPISWRRTTAIKVYAKLPGWFTVPTPLGSYNPDWAVLVEKDGGERLYFVVETKSGLFTDDLRDKESAQDRVRQGALQGPCGR